ncbi:hypothetical protein ES702_03703 [subsurface metagenome]
MKNYIGFIDETGVLSRDPNQRFFGIGFLKLKDTSELYEKIFKLKQRVEYWLWFDGQSEEDVKPFEFKFKNITRRSSPFYKELINIYFSYPQNYFCGFIIDKKNPEIKIEEYFETIWDAYINLSRMVIEKNMNSPDRIFILADYLGRPNYSEKYYEKEINESEINGEKIVFNTCMIESHASLLIQIVDVLIGAIRYDFTVKRDKKFISDRIKYSIVEEVSTKLNRGTLAENFTVHSPNYFSVWEFRGI